MRVDIEKWAKLCRVCASTHMGQPLHPLQTPTPITGPFDRVGVDVIPFSPSRTGNKYAVVFLDYLTKWPEVKPI